MIYERCQAIRNNAPQRPKFHPNTIHISHVTVALPDDGAERLLSLSVLDNGIKGSSTGGFGYLEEEVTAHKSLHGAIRLISDDTRISDATLNGRRRYLATFLVPIEGGVRTRAVARAEGELQ